MTREIKTPADAVPHDVHQMHESEPELTMPFFTAAECAQIAVAYLKAYRKEGDSVWKSEKEHKKADAELKAWRAKFKEWQST